MDPASYPDVTLRSFSTSAKAADYLKNADFVFMGAPGRCLRLEETGPVYARIVPTTGTFQVRVCRLQRGT